MTNLNYMVISKGGKTIGYQIFGENGVIQTDKNILFQGISASEMAERAQARIDYLNNWDK